MKRLQSSTEIFITLKISLLPALPPKTFQEHEENERKEDACKEEGYISCADKIIKEAQAEAEKIKQEAAEAAKAAQEVSEEKVSQNETKDSSVAEEEEIDYMLIGIIAAVLVIIILFLLLRKKN